MSKLASSYLFDLINSLTGAEKKYFKLVTSSSKNGKAVFLELFNAIEKQDIFNDQELYRSLIKVIGSYDNYKVAKSALYAQVLKIMRQYGMLNEGIDNRLDNYVSDIQFLLQKRKIEQAKSMLEKAQKIAVAYQRKFHLIRLIDFEFKILAASENSDLIQEHDDKLLKQSKYVLDGLGHYFTMLNLELHSYEIIFANNFESAKPTHQAARLAELLQSKTFGDEVMSQSLEIELSHFELNELYLEKKAYAENGKADWNYLYKSHVAFLANIKKKNLLLLESYPHRYLILLTNILRAANNLSIRACKHALALFNEPRFANPLLSALQKFRTYYIALRLAYVQGSDKDFTSALTEFDPPFQATLDFISPNNRLQIYSKSVSCYLMFWRFKDAEKELKKIFAIHKTLPELRTDIIRGSYLDSCLIQHELGNYKKFRANVRATMTFLKNENGIAAIDQLLLDYLEQSIKVSADDRKPFIKELLKNIKKITSEHGTITLLQHFNYKGWFQSKLADDPQIAFINIIRKENKLAPLNQA